VGKGLEERFVRLPYQRQSALVGPAAGARLMRTGVTCSLLIIQSDDGRRGGRSRASRRAGRP
jgi:hypothetical protein